MNIKKNVIWMGLYDIFIYICPLITAPYIARVLGTYGTGVYSYTYSILSYFIVFVQLGSSLYGRREIAACHSKKQISETFWSILSIETLMFVLCSLIYLWFVSTVSEELKKAFIFQYIALIGSWLDISWFFFGLEDFKVAVSRNIVVKLMSLFFVFTLIKTADDANLYVLLMALSNLLSVAVMWIKAYSKISVVAIRKLPIKKHLIPLFKMTIPVISTQLFSMADKVFLGYMIDVDIVGIYENAFKISRVPVALITAIGTVLLPRMTKLYAENRVDEFSKYFNPALSYTLIIGIGSAFGICGIASTFIPLYLGDGFLGAIPVLRVLSFVLIVISWGNAFRTLYILPQKMDGLYIKSVAYAAAINILLNAVLIPIYSAIGAAIASVFSELVICIYQSIKIREKFNFSALIKQNFKYFIAGIVMFVWLLALGKIMVFSNALTAVIIQILTGLLVYVVMIVILESFGSDRYLTEEICNITHHFIIKMK